MEEAQSVNERAKQIAEDIAGTETEIVRHTPSGSRQEFDYDGGCIHAHKIPDDWEFTGFGTGWFSMREK